MLTIRNVTKRFGNLSVLEHIDLSVEDGEILVVVGPSGCGKTTLANLVAGFIRPDGGSVDAFGGRVGYVFQEDRLLPWRTVRENIGLVRDTTDSRAVQRLIDLVGLTGFESFYPDELSGGMRQRCSIARAYHYESDVLLMDEPFRSLDHSLRFEMLAVLMKVRRERKNSILAITHDIDEALAIASRIAVMGKRPARILEEFTLGNTEYPRDVDSAELLAIKREVITRLG